MKRVLLKLLRLITYGIIVPILTFLGTQFRLFFESQKPKITGAYWQQKWQALRRYNWKKPKLSDLRYVFRVALKSLLFLLLAFTMFYLAVYTGFIGGSIPSRAELKAIQNNTASEVYSADKVLLGRYYIQDRTNIRYDQIAPVAIDALIATEDVRFYEHGGVDTRSVLVCSLKLCSCDRKTPAGAAHSVSNWLKTCFRARASAAGICP